MSYFLRTSAAEVRRMRRLVVAASPTRELAKILQLAPRRARRSFRTFDEYPGEATELVAYPVIAGGEKKEKGSRRDKRKGVREKSFPSPPFRKLRVRFNRERCYNATDTYREVIMVSLLFGPFLIRQIETARTRHVFLIIGVHNVHVLYGAQSDAICRRGCMLSISF